MNLIVRVWDAPTRLFHWALVLCLIGLVITSQIGGAAMEWHFRFGYGVLTLLLFRLVWGFQGGYWSRFANFVYWPKQISRYLQGRGEPHQHVGHNPLGALSVFSLLAILTLQVGSGLMSDDEIAAAGPLTRFVSSDWVSYATFYHKEIGKLMLLALVALHLSAIGYHYFHKHENLVRPMVSGDKTLAFATERSSDTSSDRVRALVIFLACSGLIAGLLAWAN